MTLNGVTAVILRYFTEFGKHAFQHITASICGGKRASIVFCSRCTMSSYRKFTFAISSPDKFLVFACNLLYISPLSRKLWLVSSVIRTDKTVS